MTGVLCGRGREDGDGDQSYASASREQPDGAGQPREAGKRQGEATSQVSGEQDPANT